jgi:hypothetical protein
MDKALLLTCDKGVYIDCGLSKKTLFQTSLMRILYRREYDTRHALKFN